MEKRIPKLPSYDFWRKTSDTLHDIGSGHILLTCYPSNGGRPGAHNHVSVDVAQYHIIFSNNKTHVQPSSRTTQSHLAYSPSRSNTRHLKNLTDSLKENIHFRKVTSEDIGSSCCSVSFALQFIDIYETPI
jgi:hypothetical protein